MRQLYRKPFIARWPNDSGETAHYLPQVGMTRVAAIAGKEFLHILRDPRSLAIAILMPLAMVVLYGYAIDMELKRVRVGVLDYDRTPASRRLVREMTSGEAIVMAQVLLNRSEIESGFRKDRFRAALIIPSGYARDLERGPAARVQLIVDGADATTAATVENYLNAVIARINRSSFSTFSSSLSTIATLPIAAEPRIWFNPALASAVFVVPGLVALVLTMICALLTSIAIARERETGTLEQMLTTPVQAGEIIIGKVLPYLTIGALDAVIILLAGRFIFGVPMAGSWLALTGYCFIYLLVALGLGLLVSTLARTQQIAMMMALMMTLLPTLLLSGFIFPVASMPAILQMVSRIIPANDCLKVIRGVMLKGVNWYPLEGAILSLMALAILGIAIARFKRDLE